MPVGALMLPLLLFAQTTLASAQVENGKITAIGSNVAIPANSEVIDLSTSTVSPGLVDAGIPAPAIVKAMRTSATRLLGVDNELKHVSFVMKNGKAVEK